MAFKRFINILEHLLDIVKRILIKMGVKIIRQPAIPHGTYYWSCPGCNFIATAPWSENVGYIISEGTAHAYADNTTIIAPVTGLPDGAVVTGVVVYGNAAAEEITWSLVRVNMSTSASETLAAEAVNTEDTSISNATIDNSTYAYFFRLPTDEFDTNDEIYGARITYTL